MLLPFISIVKPILAIFGIDQEKVLKNAPEVLSSDFEQDSIFDHSSIKGMSARKDENISIREPIMPEIKEYVSPKEKQR